MPPLVGRDAVLADAWNAVATSTPVLLEAPAGMGKTVVLEALVARARSSGAQVLTCAPTEAESWLPLAALADLLHPLRDRAGALPGPQRVAAEAALLTDGDAKAVDERALGAATRALIEDAVEATPRGILLAVDDSSWLDPPSERALRFALRRLRGRVAVLVSVRTQDDEPADPPLGLDAVEHVRLRLPALGVGALRAILADRFGVALSRPMLARLTRESGGNPLLAIELTRAMLRRPALPGPVDDLPVVASMQPLVDATLAAVSAPARDAVRLAALLESPDVQTILAAGVDVTAVEDVEQAGLVRLDPDGRVRFVHPTHAAAVRAGTPAGLRRRLHSRLAEVCTDPDERARHLAQCVLRPGAAVADELAEAAARVRARGAPELAAGLYDRAAHLTPVFDVAARNARSLAGVRCVFDSGDSAGAGARADAVAAEVDGPARAEALLLRAAIGWSMDELSVAVDAAQRALDAAGTDCVLRGRIHAHLAVFVDLPEPARHHAEAALRLLPDPPPAGAAGVLGVDDRSMLAAALLLLFLNEVRAGEPPRPELLDRALALEGTQPLWLAGTVPAIWWKSIDKHELATRRLDWMYERALVSGDEPFQHELLTHLGETHLLAGRYPAAGEAIGRAYELGEQLGTGLAAEKWLRGMLDARRGDLGAADEAAVAGLRAAEELDDPWRRRLNLQLAGASALAAGRAAEAAHAFDALARALDAAGLVEPLASRFEDEWIEACVASGDLSTARLAYDRLAERHARLPRPWTALGLARSQVLLAGANAAPLEESLAGLVAARDSVPADVVPLERARCLLVAGVGHRRARRKQLARNALVAAIAEFDELGARAHSHRARAELDRVGAPPATPLQLTATEARVARLAVSGRTNRTIADELFISPKTVEANLARVYRKFGIATRAELGAAMSRRDA